PSFLRVELHAEAPDGGAAPQAAQVVIDGTSAYCFDVPAGGASFDLKRDASHDQAKRVDLLVTAYTSLDSTLDPGKGSNCPLMHCGMGATVGCLQAVSVAFCPGQAESVVFHLGASCTGGACCDVGYVCGAGLSVEGHACGAGECCPTKVSDACALDPAE